MQELVQLLRDWGFGLLCLTVFYLVLRGNNR